MQAPRKKQRLDEACQALRPELSRNVIQSWISLGKVQVDGKVISKAGAPVPAAANVQILAELPKFVCRYVVLGSMWNLQPCRDAMILFRRGAFLQAVLSKSQSLPAALALQNQMLWIQVAVWQYESFQMKALHWASWHNLNPAEGTVLCSMWGLALWKLISVSSLGMHAWAFQGCSILSALLLLKRLLIIAAKIVTGAKQDLFQKHTRLACNSWQLSNLDVCCPAVFSGCCGSQNLPTEGPSETQRHLPGPEMELPACMILC